MSFFSLQTSALSAIPRASLQTLRAALVRDMGDNFAAVLQETGAAGGEAVFAALRSWCASNGLDAPETLAYSQFQAAVARFFADTGWGAVTMEPIGDTAVALDSVDWAEAEPAAAMPYPSCYYTAGMLADLFGRVADDPIACQEVECRSAGAERCRFLITSPDVVAHVYQRLTEGVGYRDALKQLA